MKSSNNIPVVFKSIMQDYVSQDYCAYAIVNKLGKLLSKSIGWKVFENVFQRVFINDHLPRLVEIKNNLQENIYETEVNDFIVKCSFIYNWPDKNGCFADLQYHKKNVTGRKSLNMKHSRYILIRANNQWC